MVIYIISTHVAFYNVLAILSRLASRNLALKVANNLAVRVRIKRTIKLFCVHGVGLHTDSEWWSYEDKTSFIY